MKNKKIYLILILVSLITLVINLNKSEPQSRSSTAVQEKTVAVLQQLPIKEIKSQYEDLQAEIDVIKKELSSVDVKNELANPTTTKERRDWIIQRINLQAKKLNQMTRLEIARMNKELEL